LFAKDLLEAGPGFRREREDAAVEASSEDHLGFATFPLDPDDLPKRLGKCESALVVDGVQVGANEGLHDPAFLDLDL
jgi:hypothetical protein